MADKAFVTRFSKCLLGVSILSLSSLVIACGSHQDQAAQLSDFQFQVLESSPVVGRTALLDNANAAIGLPINASKQPELVISRKQYVISWNEQRRNPNWAAWRLSKSDFGKSPRSDSFTVDSDLESVLKGRKVRAVDPSEYKGSCYDRGHQVPSGDRKSSPEDNAATFMMSNVLPQTSFVNKVAWEHLERHERELAERSAISSLYIFSGAIYSDDIPDIGPSRDIHVPSSTYKIIVPVGSLGVIDTEARKNMIVVKVPNITSTGTVGTADKQQLCADFNRINPELSKDLNDWQAYRTTLEDIELSSGFSFSFLH